MMKINKRVVETIVVAGGGFAGFAFGLFVRRKEITNRAKSHALFLKGFKYNNPKTDKEKQINQLIDTFYEKALKCKTLPDLEHLLKIEDMMNVCNLDLLTDYEIEEIDVYLKHLKP